jgi:hypothetical protein
MIHDCKAPKDPGTWFKQAERYHGGGHKQSNVLQAVEQGLFDIQAAADSQSCLPEKLILI